MKNSAILKLAAVTCALAACVTINVYFPAAAAEKAADQIIHDVIGKSGATSQVIAAPRRVGDISLRVAAIRALAGALRGVVADAAAAAPDLDISSPAIRQITDSMKARHNDLAPYYDGGAVGYTADGLVEIRDANSIPLAQRNVVRKLLADENQDRASLYAEIAKANGHPEWQADIRSTFAKRWVVNAKSGWYYKDSTGWRQK